MTERCKQCGAELFAGQQFCRQCGARTGLLSDEDLATQILPGPQTHAPHTGATPFAGERGTAANFSARPTAPQPAGTVAQPPGAAAQPPTRPARRAFSGGTLIAVIGGTVVVTLLLVSLFYFARTNQPRSVRVVKVNPPPPGAVLVPAPPGLPDVAPRPPAGAEDVLDEGAAVVTEDKTVITKTYPLPAGAGAFELANLNGDIRVEGWDSPQAEVKITKRGGTPAQRRAVGIGFEQDATHLRFDSTTVDGDGHATVEYEIKLPRTLAHVALQTTNGDVRVVGVSAELAVTTLRGDIELKDVGGAISTNTTKGRTKVAYGAQGPSAPQSFNAINGDIEVQLQAPVNVEVRAETVSGRIDVAAALGLPVEQHMVGQQAMGRIGRGGPPLVIKTLAGDIKLKQ